MALKLGYLLPTRENVMQDRPGGRLLIDAAKHAHALGFDSIWAGDSLLARPRHEPLTLLAAVAGAVPDVAVGTAVLLPMLRNPVLLAHQLATVDQVSEGRLIVGAGIAQDTPAVRAEFVAAGVPFDKRVGRMLEGFRLCKALWTGEPVNWDGRWQVQDGTLGPKPYRPDGPPIWIGAGVRPGIERAAKHFDGWFPIGPDAHKFAERKAVFLDAAKAAERDPERLTTAIYLTVAISDDAEEADQRINSYLESYYNAPAETMRSIQACYAGTVGQVLAWIRTFVAAGAEHVILRLVGDHHDMLQQLAAERVELES
jgi:alkanesulfonate monooxygenase SsuD/methylene tetrahydromethanopterin reductase-like flavin-dependent oxidoreductase (luciferase family)